MAHKQPDNNNIMIETFTHSVTIATAKLPTAAT